jgi:chromosome segregation ATPase
MASPPTIDLSALALDPVEALRGEQSQLEDWMRESFAALEGMHGELAEWQRDLTRRHAELDQREAAIAEARDKNRLLEEVNAGQLETLEALERQLGAAQAELRTVRRHAEELSLGFEAERERAMDEHRLWTGELREMRRALLRQGQMLISLGASAPLDEDEGNPAAETAAATDNTDADPTTADAATPAAELRRRTTSRRAGNGV